MRTPSFKKRFWKTASASAAEGGFAVLLDDRRVMTPAKSPLVLPSRALAEAVAAEWQAQADKVDPATMPMTRRANAAIDKVTPQHAEVAAMLAEYGGSDLLCYRAGHPAELAARQALEWDPLLDWAAREFGARLVVTNGVMPVEQRPENLIELTRKTHAMDPFSLAGFHDLVAISGSLILAFAAVQGYQKPEDLWRISRLDEDWQAELWGRDDEAESAAARKRQDFLDAFRFVRLVNAQ